MVEHVDIADGERHEPKGAAAANSGEVYVSDGAASGSWSKPAAANTTFADAGSQWAGTDVEAVLAEIRTKENGGWGYYQDDGVSTQTIDTSAVKLSINGLGGSTTTAYLPYEIRGVSELWDTTGDSITPIATGDSYCCRLDLPFTGKTGSPTTLQVRLDISGVGTPTTVIIDKRSSASDTPPFTTAVDLPIFCLATFLANGGDIFLTVDTGTLTLDTPSIFIQRITNGAN